MSVVWRYPLQPQPYAAGTAVSGSTSLTSGLIGMSVPEIPGGVYSPGARLSLRAHGEVTSTSATPTLILGFYFGPPNTAIGSETLLGATTGMTVSATATAWAFTMIYNGTIRSLNTGVSTNGVIHGSGEVFSFFNTGLTAAGTVFPLGITAAGRTVSTFNTNSAQAVDIGVTLSSVTGTPSVTITDFWAELSG